MTSHIDHPQFSPEQAEGLKPLPRKLLAAFREAFPDLGHSEAVDRGTPLLTVPARHPESGDLRLWLQSDEVAIGVGERFHTHVATYLYDFADLGAKEDAVVEEVIDYVRDVLADRVVMSAHASNRWARMEHLEHAPTGPPEPDVIRLVWSGPFEPSASAESG